MVIVCGLRGPQSPWVHPTVGGGTGDVAGPVSRAGVIL